MITERRQLSHVLQEERKHYQKMIFVSGPRQVGKTTVLSQLNEIYPGPILNWDNLDDRSRISKEASRLFSENENIYFDEIHKQPRWKNFLKGYFDKYGSQCRIHVTGSARLDVYRRGGDSLQGRYILFRLHPFTLAEILHPSRLPKEHVLSDLLEPDERDLAKADEAWKILKKFGGFPEPFLRQSEAFYRRWRSQRHERLVREDIRDMTRIRELALLEQMVAILPDRIAQPLSLNALREDLEVSHDSVRLWTQMLEEFYYLFLIPPYNKRLARSSKKEQKVYLWDYSELRLEGALFENMVASHLLKWSQMSRDIGFKEIEIHYIKNKEKMEVDFLITEEKKPVLLIEAKLNDTTPSSNAIQFSQILGKIPVVQLVDQSGVFQKRTIDSIPWSVMSAARFFKGLV